MDVIQVILKVPIIANNMIPETPLPEVEGLLDVMCVLVISGEISLNAVHYFGEIPGRMIRFDQTMEMIGKHDICQDFKWMDFFDFFQCPKEEFDVRF